jgi:exonuclease SbcC
LYQNSDTSEKTSSLTKFVKDLLGLDQLDAIVDGLYSAFNVARIRNLIPDFRRFEALKSEIDEEVKSDRERGAELLASIETNGDS